MIELLGRYVNNAFTPESENEYGKVFWVRNEVERTFKLIIPNNALGFLFGYKVLASIYLQ